MSHSIQHRRGFKLIELVIIVAILGVLISLLLPATRKVRAAAGRMQCQNQLKQLGIALHDYGNYQGRGEFPQGRINRGHSLPDQSLSWMVSILPLLEEDQLFRRIDLKLSWEDNFKAINTPVKLFRCPFDQSRLDRLTVPYTDYVSLAGIGDDAAALPAKSPDIGFMGYDRVTTFKDITDGTSNTIMVMETAIDNGPWARGGPSTLRPFVPTHEPFHGVGRPFGGRHIERNLFSRSDLGTEVLMADGSVRHLSSEKTDTKLIAALITIAGDESAVDW